MRLSRLIVTALAAGSIATAAPAAHATGSPTATIACKQARIGGQSRCIARGQFCARRFQRDYRKYGLSCSNVDQNGRYHLR